MKTFLVIIGIVLILLGLWGGAWLCAKFPVGNDYSFAALMTGMLLAIGGCGCIGAAIQKHIDEP